jgi:hypothetical protein
MICKLKLKPVVFVESKEPFGVDLNKLGIKGWSLGKEYNTLNLTQIKTYICKNTNRSEIRKKRSRTV